MKIALCGGHVTPALACIDYIQANFPEHQLLLIGRVFAQDKGHQLAHEKELALSRRVQFVPFEGVRWESSSWWSQMVATLRLSWLLVQALRVLIVYRPQVLVSFGGYLAVPLACAAWLLRIPIVTHEQTRSAGKANIFIGKLANRIAISHPSSADSFPKKKTVLTGNLLRQAIFSPHPATPAWIKKLPSTPLLYITGGSQGSQVINAVIKKALPQLLKEFWIIHQCGKDTETHSYQTELLTAAHQSGFRKSRFIVREWLTETELAWVLQHAKLAISRAGANTVDELLAARLPALYIPLPFTHDEEQLTNAQAIVSLGGALLLEQKNLSHQTLLTSIKTLLLEADTMKLKLSKVPITQHAPAKFYQVIVSVVAKAKS